MELIPRITRRARRLAAYPGQRLRGVGVVNWRGQGVINLIDVGSVGDLPEPWHTRAPTLRHVLKFEPRDPAAESTTVRSIDTALWSEESDRELFIYRGLAGSGASLFEQNIEFVREHFEDLRSRGPAWLAESWMERSTLERVEQVHCVTLDQILEADPVAYHFLKVDAQGAEYPILRGAQQYLDQHCLGLHLELFSIPLYKGITLKDEVIALLADTGFDLVKTMPPHGSFDSQNDCIFLRRDAHKREVETIRNVYGLPTDFGRG